MMFTTGINVLQKKIKEIEAEIKSRSQVKNEYAKFSDVFKLAGKIEADLEYAKKELPEPFSSEGMLTTIYIRIRTYIANT